MRTVASRCDAPEPCAVVFLIQQRHKRSDSAQLREQKERAKKREEEEKEREKPFGEDEKHQLKSVGVVRKAKIIKKEDRTAFVPSSPLKEGGRGERAGSVEGKAADDEKAVLADVRSECLAQLDCSPLADFGRCRV